MYKRLRMCSSEESDSSSEQHKRLRTFSTPSVGRYSLSFSSQDVIRNLEPSIRSMVRVPIEAAVSSFIKSMTRMPPNPLHKEAARQLQLQFRSKLPGKFYTSSQIKADNSSPVQVVLVDTRSNKIVEEGRLSSIKLCFVAVKGKFCCDGQEDWSEEEFSRNVLHARDGKPELLKGDLVVKLSNGICQMGDLRFTDNASWTEGKNFKLGARALDHSCEVREGLTEAFCVLDQRGEGNKKTHPPSLDDEVWRLEKIGRDGVFHKKLNDHGITTVSHILSTDEASLRSILGSKMSDKSWKKMIEHARESCPVNKDNPEILACTNGNDICQINSASSYVPENMLLLPNPVDPCALAVHEGPISEFQQEPSQLVKIPNMQSFYVIGQPFSLMDELLPRTTETTLDNVPLSPNIFPGPFSELQLEPSQLVEVPSTQSFDPVQQPFSSGDELLLVMADTELDSVSLSPQIFPGPISELQPECSLLPSIRSCYAGGQPFPSVDKPLPVTGDTALGNVPSSPEIVFLDPISELQREPSQPFEMLNGQVFYPVRQPFPSVDELLPVTADTTWDIVPSSPNKFSGPQEPSQLFGISTMQSFYLNEQLLSSVAELLPVTPGTTLYNVPCSSHCDLSISDYEISDMLSQALSRWAKLLISIKFGSKLLAARRKAAVPLACC